MLKGLGTGISITQTTQPEPAEAGIETAQPAEPAETPAQASSLNSAGKTALKAEAMFSASAQQARLLKQVEVKPPQASVADSPQPATTMGFGWRDDPLKINAERSAILQGPGPSQFEASRNEDVVKQFGLEREARIDFRLPRTLSTGDGDDKVEINMGTDGRMHVNVNGKEAWSGTPKEFQTLTIDTGAGNDTVTNNVNGSKISTGSGDDVVVNNANQALIETGDGNDTVRSKGYGNEILTGEGKDTVDSEGDINKIVTGGGDDTVRSKGEENEIFTGSGNDSVHSLGHSNTIDSGSGDDTVNTQGGKNILRTGDGDDVVHMENDPAMYGPFHSEDNRVDTGAGNDKVWNSTDYAKISTGEGNDDVLNSGDHAYIQTGQGEDWVQNRGIQSNIETGEGNDFIENEYGYGTRIKTGEGKDAVWVSNNHDYQEWNGHRYIDREIDKIDIDTGGDGDFIYNRDGSKIIVDGEEK